MYVATVVIMEVLHFTDPTEFYNIAWAVDIKLKFNIDTMEIATWL